MKDGDRFAITITFTVINGGKSFDDIEIIAHSDVLPEVIMGGFFLHLGHDMLSGRSKPFERTVQ